jgi:hypothetical protein
MTINAYLRDANVFHKTIERLAKILDFREPARVDKPIYLNFCGMIPGENNFQQKEIWTRAQIYRRDKGYEITAVTCHLTKENMDRGEYIKSQIITNFQVGFKEKIIEYNRARMMGFEMEKVIIKEEIGFMVMMMPDELAVAHKKGYLPKDAEFYHPSLDQLAEMVLRARHLEKLIISYGLIS